MSLTGRPSMDSLPNSTLFFFHSRSASPFNTWSLKCADCQACLAFVLKGFCLGSLRARLIREENERNGTWSSCRSSVCNVGQLAPITEWLPHENLVSAEAGAITFLGNGASRKECVPRKTVSSLASLSP